VCCSVLQCVAGYCSALQLTLTWSALAASCHTAQQPNGTQSCRAVACNAHQRESIYTYCACIHIYSHIHIFMHNTWHQMVHSLAACKTPKSVSICIFVDTRITSYIHTRHMTQNSTLSCCSKNTISVSIYIYICAHIHIFASSYIHARYTTRNGTLSRRSKNRISMSIYIYVNIFIYSCLHIFIHNT